MPKDTFPAAAVGLPCSIRREGRFLKSEESRRGFLRSLAGLPLIGGGLTLIGQPTAVAEPVTTQLMDAYIAFLAHEHRAALLGTRDCHHAPMYWFPEHPVIDCVDRQPPAARAALIMSAVGFNWKGGLNG